MSDKKLGRLRGFLRQLLHLEDSPERTALAFSIGVFFSFSPFVGLHTIMGLATAFLFKLNRLALLIGVYVNNPWTLAPVASLGTALGFYILGTENKFAETSWDTMLNRAFWKEMFSDVENLLLPFFVGNLILSVAAGMIAYVIMKRVLVRHRTQHEGQLGRSS
jgi:uncharacterized protein (DUF2062 family)